VRKTLKDIGIEKEIPKAGEQKKSELLMVTNDIETYNQDVKDIFTMLQSGFDISTYVEVD